jgi:hypothetical protein
MKAVNMKQGVMIQESLFSSDQLGRSELAPQHTTHRGGRGEPYHDWYPYLEGFSSEFVRHVLSEYMPKARRIIEPFAGTGTTPVVLSELGIDCGYCEVNPAMRLVVDAKMGVGRLKKQERASLIAEICELSSSLEKQVTNAPSNTQLAESYSQNFGQSQFFSDTAYSALLSMRTIADTLFQHKQLLGSLFVVAVMAKIVTCSLLKRAGDVRYKTEKELEKGIPDITKEVANQLLLIARDCEASLELQGDVKLITPNAKNLNSKQHFRAQGVITSPPYLNGTNYFRNTKLELWFGKFLVGPSALRGFRDQAITSGINDVGANQGRVHINDAVRCLVSELEAKAYDQRIPRMVAGYFEDMKLVIEGLAAACEPGSAICIDIGDSRYGGIHVPTHDILALIGQDIGLKHEDTVHLRDRLSKDKSKLSQSLVVLRKAIN